MLNPDPLIEALETVTLAVLVFLTARVWEFLLPTATVPNDTDDGVEVSEAACVLPAPTVSRVAAAKNMVAEAKNRWEGPPG